MKLGILNAAVVTAFPGTFSTSASLSVDEARKLIDDAAGDGYQSYIGHPGTVAAVRNVLERDIEAADMSGPDARLAQEVGQIVLIVQVANTRALHGRELSQADVEACGMRFYEMRRAA